MNTLDIDLLRAFHVVCKLGRFKDAASYLNKSPSTITMQIKRLEDTIGQRLLLRNNNSVKLTDFGLEFINSISSFLELHDNILSSISSVSYKGKIRFGLPDSYADQFMTNFISLFMSSNPLVELNVEASSSRDIATMYYKDALDIAIIVTENKYEKNSTLLGECNPVWVASSRFKKKENQFIPLALQLPGCPYRKVATTILDETNRKYKIVLSSANSNAVESCIRSGISIGIMDKQRVDHDLMICNSDFNLPDLGPFYIHLLSNNDNEAVRFLKNVLINKFKF